MGKLVYLVETGVFALQCPGTGGGNKGQAKSICSSPSRLVYFYVLGAAPPLHPRLQCWGATVGAARRIENKVSRRPGLSHTFDIGGGSVREVWP